MTQLYVGNLPASATETGLRTRFARFGRVCSVSIQLDSAAGCGKHFGFVEMGSEAEAQTATSQLNMTLYDDTVISVNRFRIKIG
jgi:cold-inducible RNA-binding protein